MITCTVRKISFPALPSTNYHLNLQKYIVCWPISTLNMQNWPTWQRCGQNTSLFLCDYRKQYWLVTIIYISVETSPNYANKILSLLLSNALFSRKTVLCVTCSVLTKMFALFILMWYDIIFSKSLFFESVVHTSFKYELYIL